MIGTGWILFAIACVLGSYAVRHDLPVYNSYDFAHAVVMDGDGVILRLAAERVPTYVACKLAVRGGELAGAVLFAGGLLSIVLLNRRDAVRTWKPRAL